MDDQPQSPAAIPSAEPPAADPPKRPRRWPWSLAAVILLLGVIAFYTHRKSPAGAVRGRYGRNQSATLISTATAQTGNINVYVNALGIVTPLNTVSVEARVAGQIVQVHYQEGQLVHTGDPLVDIDTRPYQAAVLQAEGQLARDSAVLADAKLDLARYQEAYASQAIPRQQYDTQVALVHQDEGTVQFDQGNLDSAKVNLAYCHITAPITGHVGLRLVDPGNIVQANGTSPLVIITQLRPISVIFNVAEDYLPQIVPPLRQGKKLVADVFDRADQKQLATGTLKTLDNEIDPATGTLKLRADFSNDNETLFPNQFVNVRLLVATHEHVTLLPNTVIQRNAESAFVYLLQPGDTTIAVHSITVGTTEGNVSEVGGLNPGAVVAADNFNRLMDGAKVTVRPTSSSGGVTPTHSKSGAYRQHARANK